MSLRKIYILPVIKCSQFSGLKEGISLMPASEGEKIIDIIKERSKTKD